VTALEGGPLPTIAFIGLGNMGRPMCQRLLEAGYPVAGYDAAASARAAAAADGITVAESLPDAASSADVLILMLPTSAIVTSVLIDQDVLGMLPDSATVIDMGSSDPMVTRSLAATARESGRVLIDAPVSGGVSGAVAGSLTIMVGGESGDVSAVTPILETMGGQVTHVGPVGAGHALKAINNLLSATHLLVSSEALLVGREFGLTYEAMLEVINRSSGKSGSTEAKWPKFVLPGTYDSGFSLALMAKDMTIAVGLAEALGWSASLSRASTELWQEAAHETPAGTDHTAIVEWLRQQHEED